MSEYYFWHWKSTSQNVPCDVTFELSQLKDTTPKKEKQQRNCMLNLYEIFSLIKVNARKIAGH